jgi:hypothetical protein
MIQYFGSEFVYIIRKYFELPPYITSKSLVEYVWNFLDVQIRVFEIGRTFFGNVFLNLQSF